MKTGSRRILVLGWVLASVSLVACAAVFGFEDLVDQQDASTRVDAVTDASADAGAPGRSFCVLGLDKPTPAQVQSSCGVDNSYSFALSSLTFVPKPDEPLGLDLDCTRTFERGTTSCRLDPNADDQFFSSYIRDRQDGIDNAAGQLFTNLDNGGLDFFKVRDLAARVQNGLLGVNLALKGVCSFEDDDQVGVEAYPARFVDQEREGGCPPPDGPIPPGGPLPDAGPRAPRPEDRWCLDSRFVEKPLAASDAWIRGRFLVAFFPDFFIPLLDPRPPVGQPLSRLLVYVHLTDVWVRARIEREAGSTTLVEGVIAGRWATSQLLHELGLMSAEQPPGEACTLRDSGVALVEATRGALCPGRDILAAVPPPDPEKPCTALSTALGFEAYQVDTIGKPSRVGSYLSYCENAGGGTIGTEFNADCE